MAHKVIKVVEDPENEVTYLYLDSKNKLSIAYPKGVLPAPAVRWLTHHFGREFIDTPILALGKNINHLPVLTTDFIGVTLED